MRPINTLVLFIVFPFTFIFAQSPISFYQEFNGSVDFITTAGTFRDGNNNTNASASSLRNTAFGDLTIPAGAEVGAAFLYWAGSGRDLDNNVVFDGSNVSATRFFSDTRMEDGFNI